jgi:hypothetical protein
MISPGKSQSFFYFYTGFYKRSSKPHFFKTLKGDRMNANRAGMRNGFGTLLQNNTGNARLLQATSQKKPYRSAAHNGYLVWVIILHLT